MDFGAFTELCAAAEDHAETAFEPARRLAAARFDAAVVDAFDRMVK